MQLCRLQDTSLRIEGLKAEVADLTRLRQQAQHGLTEMEKKRTGAEEALAHSRKQRQQAQRDLEAEKKGRQVAEAALADLKKTHDEAAKVSWDTTLPLDRHHVCLPSEYASAGCIHKRTSF